MAPSEITKRAKAREIARIEKMARMENSRKNQILKPKKNLDVAAYNKKRMMKDDGRPVNSLHGGSETRGEGEYNRITARDKKVTTRKDSFEAGEQGMPKKPPNVQFKEDIWPTNTREEKSSTYEAYHITYPECNARVLFCGLAYRCVQWTPGHLAEPYIRGTWKRCADMFNNSHKFIPGCGRMVLIENAFQEVLIKLSTRKNYTKEEGKEIASYF